MWSLPIALVTHDVINRCCNNSKILCRRKRAVNLHKLEIIFDFINFHVF